MCSKFGRLAMRCRREERANALPTHAAVAPYPAAAGSFVNSALTGQPPMNSAFVGNLRRGSSREMTPPSSGSRAEGGDGVLAGVCIDGIDGGTGMACVIP